MTAKKKITTGNLEEKIAKWDKAKPKPKQDRQAIAVSPDELNEAVAEAALDRMDYPQGSGNTHIDPDVQRVADSSLDVMDCPLTHMKKWDCNKVPMGEAPSHPYFEQGEELQCKHGGFVKCPAYHRYFNFRIKYQARLRSKDESSQ